jgi:hypothetical protein
MLKWKYPSKEERDKRLKAAHGDSELLNCGEAGAELSHPLGPEGAQYRHDDERPAAGHSHHQIGDNA